MSTEAKGSVGISRDLKRDGMECLLLALHWVVIEQAPLFQEFKMQQNVAVNESQKDICAQWDLCKEEMPEEGAELVSLGKGSVFVESIHSEFSEFQLKTRKVFQSSVELEDKDSQWLWLLESTCFCS